MNAILLAILFAILAIAAMYFCKQYTIGRRDKDDYSDMPELMPNFETGPDGERVVHFAPQEPPGVKPDVNYFSMQRCEYPHMFGREYRRHKQNVAEVIDSGACFDVGQPLIPREKWTTTQS